jgi:hypothetical protein
MEQVKVPAHLEEEKRAQVTRCRLWEREQANQTAPISRRSD